jgi:hypothetical protein
MKATLQFYRVDPITKTKQRIFETGCYFDFETLTTSAKQFFYYLGLLRMKEPTAEIIPQIYVFVGDIIKWYTINTFEDHSVRVHWKERVEQ